MRYVLLIAYCLLALWGNAFAQQQNVKIHSTGLSFDDGTYEQMPLKARLTRSAMDDVPARVGLESYCPTPADQGIYNTCVGWASAYAARTIAYALENGITNKDSIDALAFSPLFVYRNICKVAKPDCNTFTSMADALNLLENKGVARNADLPGQCIGAIPGSLYQSAEKYKISGFTRLFDLNASAAYKIEMVKKTLASAYPVVIGLNCPASLQMASTALWEPKESPYVNYGGHAVCVVGYDNHKYGGAFRIMNSWGTEWGDSGFIWVKYADFGNFARYAYDLEYVKKQKLSADGQQSLEAKLRIVSEGGEELPLKYNGMKGLLNADNTNRSNYSLSHSLKSGNRFKIYLHISATEYVYIISADQTGKIDSLFPYNSIVSPYFSYTSQEIALPDENTSIELDEVTGKETVLVLLSHEPLNLGELINGANKLQGSLQQKFGMLLKDKLAAPGNMIYGLNEASFSSKARGNEVLPLTIEMEHQ